MSAKVATEGKSEKVSEEAICLITLRINNPRTWKTSYKSIYTTTVTDIIESVGEEEVIVGYDIAGMPTFKGEFTKKQDNDCKAISALLSACMDNKVHPTKVWRYRENTLQASRLLVPQPIRDEYFTREMREDHYVHMHKADDPETIEYLESPERTWYSKYTAMKFGRYLKRHIPTMKDDIIATAVKKLIAANTPHSVSLRVARTKPEVDTVFETKMAALGSGGTASCMFGKFSTWRVKPYHVYADNPDIAVAYLVDDVTSEIVARSVINMLDSKWVRLYAAWVPDPTGVKTTSSIHNSMGVRLQNALAKEGWKENGSLVGCRIPMLPLSDDPTKLIGPYIDTDHCWLAPHPTLADHLIVIKNDRYCIPPAGATYQAHLTDGYFKALSKITCIRCGRLDWQADAVHLGTIYGGGWICQHCLDHYCSAWINHSVVEYVLRRDSSYSPCRDRQYYLPFLQQWATEAADRYWHFLDYCACSFYTCTGARVTGPTRIMTNGVFNTTTPNGYYHTATCGHPATFTATATNPVPVPVDYTYDNDNEELLAEEELDNDF